MTTGELGELMTAARSLLADDFELGMMNDIPEGYAGTLPSDVPEGYEHFVREANGAIFGVLVIFDVKVAVASQFYADPKEGVPVRLNRDDWFCIGKVNEDPVFLERATGAVWGFPDTGVIWWQSHRFEQLADNLEAFVLSAAFGPGYAALTPAPSEDSWLTVLRRLGSV